MATTKSMEHPDSINYVLRVYALIINKQREIMLSDEFRFGQRMTKFPGGGMLYGEGPIDCIRREALEEFGQEIEILNHYYTTHFYQRALFYEDHQLISIYYKARFKSPPTFKISGKPFDFVNEMEGSQSFRWAGIKTLGEDNLSFPVDRYVLKLLKADSDSIL